VNQDLVKRLYRRAKADRWALPPDAFAAALDASVERASPAPSNPRELERYLNGLHLEDLALACACAAGHDAAWEHFVLEHRPILYRSADALAPGGGARELADSLYADLYGLDDRKPDDRRSLFRYFHGRSSLATWLRAVLAQRFVDRVREGKRLEPLPDEDAAPAAVPSSPDPDRPRFVTLVQRALKGAVSRLTPRDRLRLASYYVQDLTLAQTGCLLREHEATVSRQLARTRRILRDDVEDQLRAELGRDDEVKRCLASVAGDAGPLDLAEMLGSAAGRKNAAADRSI